ncbi:MAG TPA: SH3 domain-containing protein [Bacillales bacterium]|nr:SH3 domain-containing protein [Bacillales bacterium]
MKILKNDKPKVFGVWIVVMAAACIAAFEWSNEPPAPQQKESEERTMDETYVKDAFVKESAHRRIEEQKAVLRASRDSNKAEKQTKRTTETETSNETEKESKPPAVTPVKPTTKYVTASALNVRKGPGTSHSVLMVVRQGSAVVVNGLSGSWSKVKVNEDTGWVSSRYLANTKPEIEKAVGKINPAPASDEKSAPATAPAAPAKKQTANRNAADRLHSVDGNRQLILVTTNGSHTSQAKIRTFEKDAKGKWHIVLNTSGYIGKYGFTGHKREGDKKSPIGKFAIGTAFGRSGNPGTKLPFRNITSDDVWVDDSKSPLYNTWQSKSKTKGQWDSAENMNIPEYTYGFVIRYNTSRVPYKGSAIFFHINNSYTLGCTATSRSNVVKILRWLDPAQHPVIIQTPVQALDQF